MIAVITLPMATLGCGASPLGLLTGGGPNVAANVPVAVGGEVDQTQGVSINNEAPRVSLRPNSRVGTIDQSNNPSQVSSESVDTIVVNEIPVWMVLVFGLLCGFVIPSPKEIVRNFINLFRKTSD